MNESPGSPPHDPAHGQFAARRKHAQIWGIAAVLGSCCAIQGSAALAFPIFNELSPSSVAAWRQLIGGLALLIALRPRLTGRPLGTWVLIIALGISMATMNVFYYAAVAHLPLGVAASLLYLGPFALAAGAIRRPVHLLWPVLALIGVGALTRPDQADVNDVRGVIFGALAAAALAAYTFTAHRLGSRAGYGELALAVGLSGLLLLPFALSHPPRASGETMGILLLIGVVGVGLAFLLDFIALRLAGPIIVATLFALDPAIGALIGGLVLGDQLTWVTFAGIALIVAAGIGLARSRPLRRPTPRTKAT